MTCQEIRAHLIEGARVSAPPSPALSQHLRQCPDCAAFYQSQLDLTSAMRTLSAIEAPASVGNRVFAELDRQLTRQHIRFGWGIGAVAALAAALTVGVTLSHRHTAPETAEEPFVEIPYTAPLAPYERAEVRHMNIPVAALNAAGFQTSGFDAGATVPADVLLGQDGRVHAIRLDRN